jgi:tape measure domain-containing protein
VADYNANIKVNADTRQAESQLKKLQSSLDKLSNFSSKINLQNAQREFNKLGTTLRGIGERGALGAITLGAGKATTAIGALGAKFGIVGAAAASAGTAINSALGGVPSIVTDILSQVGNIPNAFGLAAVAAMAFAPQILKASATTVGLGAAIDKAIGKETTEKFANVIGNVGLLNTELKVVKSSFEDLVPGSTLNQLNAQLRDAVKQSGAYHSSTADAVTAAQQLVTTLKAQAAEQRAINDLVRKAKGITQTELQESKAIQALKTKRKAQEYLTEETNKYNAEIDEYNRLAQEAARATKQWEQSLKAVNTAAKAGVLGSSSQIRTRLQEMRENRRSADIARERSAALLGVSGAMQGPGALGDVARAEANRVALRKQAVELIEQERQKARQNLQLMTNWTTVLREGVVIKKDLARLTAKELQDRKDAFTVANRELDFELRLERVQRRRAQINVTKQKKQTPEQQIGGLLKGRVGSAAIGGAFPLLFGQSGLAAVGGLIGGALGGAGGGFAGSLVGTLIGDLINAQNEIKDLAREMGLGAEQSKLLGRAFQQAGADADKFRDAVNNLRGVGFVGDEEITLIRLASKLTDDYGGRVDKIASAYAKIASSGKSSLSDIIKFTGQSIPILSQLEKNLGKNRAEILQLAKDGKISAQQTSDALFDIANSSEQAAKEARDPWYDTWKDIKDTGAIVVERIKILFAPLAADLDGVAKSIADSFRDAFKAVADFANAAAIAILNAFATVVEKIGESSQTMSGLPLVGGFMKEDAERMKKLADEARKMAADLKSAGLDSKNAPALQKVTLPGLQDPDGSRARDKKGRKSRIPQLQQELLLAQQLAGINDKIRAAEFDQDQALQIRLKGEADVLKLASDISMVRLSDVPAAEKVLQIAKLEVDIRERQKTTTLELATLERDRLRSFQNTIEGLELELASSQALTREELNRLEIEKKRLALRDNKDLTQKQKEDIIKLEEALQKQRSPLQSLITDGKRQLNDLEQVAVSVSQGIGNAIANSMSQGIVGLIEGTKNAQQVFADFLKSVGDILIQEGTRMIATYIAIGIAKAFAGLAGGGGGGGTSYSGGNVSTNAFNSGGIPGLSNTSSIGGNYFPTSTSFTPYASGGFVTGPTRAVVGEGGEPEYIIPASKMRGAMNRYAAGARGSAVIPFGGDEGGMGGTATAAPAAIDVRYTVERINTVDYVTADQFRSGMQQAAQQGAQQGEQRTLRRLQMSTSTRKRLGM